jgi:hypothetical protein
MSFIIGENRAKYVAGLFRKDLLGMWRQAWRQVATEFGDDPAPAEKLDLTSFIHESCICCFWDFPPARYVGEAIYGMIVAGPSENWPSQDCGKVPVRYYVLERGAELSTTIMEWSPRGFVSVGPGPRPGEPTTIFADMVFDRLFGKKRPTAEEAARRLLILKHLVVYAHASVYGKRLHQCPDLPEAARADLHSIMGGMFSETLKKQNLWEHVSPIEREFFECSVANLKEQQVVNASWRSEAVRTLMWALGMIHEFPSYDASAHGEITAQVKVDDPLSFISSARLRDDKEIDRARDIAQRWHWRSRTRQLMTDDHPFQPSEALKRAGLNTLDDVVRMTAQMAAKDGQLPPLIADDFPVKGKAYRDLTDDEWAEVRSITAERHCALNWLCGYAPGNDWDNTPTET